MGLEFAKRYGGNVYSQNNEDGILTEIIHRIKPPLMEAVEFGAPSFYYCSNTALLADSGWKVRMYDINDNIDARIHKAFITPDNVNDIIKEPSVLSIDVDGEDYHIWNAYKGKPSVVIIEINSSIPPTVNEIPGDHGASYKSMVELALSKGYFLICHTGNLCFVLNKYSDLFDEIDSDPIGNYHLFFNTSFLC